MQSKNSPKPPSHVAIIMDGNNRWAKTKDLPGVSGHQKGVERAREAVEYAVEKKLKTLTLFAFSSENWGRSNEEVGLLVRLLAQALEEQVPNLIKNKVQLSFIGDLSKFDLDLQRRIKKAEKLTLCSKDKNLELSETADPGIFKNDFEKNLFKKIKELKKYFSNIDKDENYETTLDNLKTAKPIIFAFFDNIVVNDDDEVIKKNRLELLQMFCRTFENYINFSKIESI